MAPRGKGANGKEGLKPGDGSEKDLGFFQREFASFKQKPDAYMRRNGPFAELERLCNSDNQQTSRLARLCRARILYEFNSKDSKAFVGGILDVDQRLGPLVTGQPRSLTAACLLAAWHLKSSFLKGDAWSVTADKIKELHDACAAIDGLSENEWADPTEEAIKEKDKEKFEDFKDAKTKMERLKQLQKYLGKALLKANTERTKHVQQLQQSAQQPQLMQQLTQAAEMSARQQSSQPLLDARAQEGKPDEDGQVQPEGARSLASASGNATETEKQKEKIREEVAQFMDAVGGKLQEAGPEGSPERARVLREILGRERPVFDKEISEVLSTWLANFGGQGLQLYKAVYERQLSAQLQRFRGTGCLLQLERPDLKDILEKTYNFSLQDAVSSAAAGGKEDKGDVTGNSGKGAAGRRGPGKVGAKDQDKKTAIVDVASTATPMDVGDFLDWFTDKLKEQGEVVRDKVIEAALEVLSPPVDKTKSTAVPADQEVDLLKQRKNTAPALADMLLLRLEDQPTGLVAATATGSELSLPSRLSQEIANRTRLGQLLVNGPVTPPEQQPWSGLDPKKEKLKAITKERVRFASRLRGLPILQRYDVLEAIANRIAVLASIADENQAAPDGTNFVVYPVGFELPGTPQEILQGLGDPVAALEGYAQLLRHRGWLPLEGEVPKVDGWDETDVRLLRLCDWLHHTKDQRPSEIVFMAVHLQESTKKEHVEMVRRLCGELPTVLAKRHQAKLEVAAKAASGELPNGNCAADADGTSAAVDLGAHNPEATTNGGVDGAQDDGADLFGPFLEFDIRTELPAEERAAINGRWRQDILDAVTVLQGGSCGLGRRFSLAIATYIAESLGVSHTNVVVTAKGLHDWIARLDTEKLLHLRFFMISQLGARADGTLSGIKDRYDRFQRVAHEELWAVEVVPGAGSAADRVQLSDRAYWGYYRRRMSARRKRIIRLQVLHAMARVVGQRKAATGGGAAAAAPVVAVPTATAPSGGGKKKGKGGAAAQAAAAAGGEADSWTLPPLPPNVPQLDVSDTSDLFDMIPASELDDSRLLALLDDEELVCGRETAEHMQAILDPEYDVARLQAEPAETAVLEELLGAGSSATTMECSPPFTLREVLEDLTRASLLEALRLKTMEELHVELEELIKVWAGLMEEFARQDKQQQFAEELKPHVSEWLLDLMDKARAELGGQPNKLSDLLAGVDKARRNLTAAAFALQSRVIRFSVLHHAARAKTASELEDKVKALLARKDPQPASGKAVGKGKGRGQENSIEEKRNGELRTELQFITAEKEFLKEMKDKAIKYADEALALSKEENDLVVRQPLPVLLPYAAQDTPHAAAQLLLQALEAAQHAAFNMLVVEMVIEEVQLQARYALSQAVTTDPVLEIGVIGTAVLPNWLRQRLNNVVTQINTERLLAEENEAKARKEAKEAKKLAAQNKREVERKEAEEEARKLREEEEKRERQEREEQEARERQEQEARERMEREEQEARAAQRAAGEEAKKKPSRMGQLLESDHYAYIIDMEAWKEEEAKEAEAKAAAERLKAQQAGAKGGSEATAGGKKEAPVVRLSVREKEKDQLKPPPPQQQDSRGRRDGGGWPPGPQSAVPGATKGDSGPRRGGAGPAPQQQQQQTPQGAAPARHRDGGGSGSVGGAGPAGAGAPAPPGRDVVGKGGPGPQQTPGGPGKGDRGGQPGGPGAQQQQQQQGSKGGPPGKGGGGGGGGKAGSAAPPAAAQPSQPRTVPGFDPEAHPGDPNRPKGRRRGRGGGGGQGDAPSAAAAAAATAAGRAAAASRGEAAGAGGLGYGSNEEHPHPPAAAGGPPAAEGGEVAMLDLTEPEQQPQGEADAGADFNDKYPFVHPYPFEPPEGWMVYEGYLFPADTDPASLTEVELEQQRAGGTCDPVALDTFRQFYHMELACGYMRERQPPSVPPEALKDYVPPAPHARPYAVAAAVPPDYQQQHGGGAMTAAGGGVGMPPGPYGAVAPPPFGVPAPPGLPGPPGPWPPYPGPLPLPQFGQPPFARPPGMPPGMLPFPGAMFPYGAPQAPRPPAVHIVDLGPPSLISDGSDTEEQQQETEDLMALLGVSQEPPRPAAPAAPTAAPAPAYQPPFPPGIPGYGGYPPPMQPYGARPPAMHGAPPMVAPDVEHQLPPPPAAAPYPAQAPQPARPVPAAAPPVLSWAERARAAKTVEPAKPVPPVVRAGPRPHGEDEDMPETDEEQMQAALLQSSLDNMNVAFPPLGGGAAAAPGGANGRMAAAGALSASQELALIPGAAVGTGLVNRVGEYNCFLNVIIQCLWHCMAFRQRMQERNPEDFEANHPVVAALLRLFRSLDAADAAREQQRQQLAHSEVATERHVVDPSELREALDALGVRAGEMNDASEVLGALFESLNRAPGLKGADTHGGHGHGHGVDVSELSVVDRTFGLLLSEEVRCTVPTCGRITHVVPRHVEYFMIITATGLRDMRAVMDIPDSEVTMGRIIREIEAQNIKRCDNDPPHHGCSTPMRVTRTLHNMPDVFTVQLAWEPNVPTEAIAGTLALVDTVLDPKHIFAGGNCAGDMPAYALHGMFCYYGQHYFAFINRGPAEPESAHEWVMFDDATVATVGNWQAVIAKCRAGRIQPSVLFYQQYR